MNNIKNKFPELRYFIENPKGYEVLYYKEDSVHNEYPLDVAEAKEIIKIIENLETQLKKQQEIINRTIEHLNIFISDERLSKYDTLKILMYAKKILEDKEVG